MSEQIEQGIEQRGFLDRLRDTEGSEQVVLYRVSGRNLEFLDRYTSGALSASTEPDILADVKAEHGGGLYELRLLNVAGQIIGRHQFSIAGLPKRPREEAATGTGNDLAALMLQMQERSDARLEKILERMADKPSSDDELTRLERFNSIVNRSAQPPVEKEKSLIERAMEKKFLEFLDGGLGGGGSEESGFGWVRELVAGLAPAIVAGMNGNGAAAPEGDDGDDTVAEVPAAPDDQAQLVKKLQMLLLGMVQLASYRVPPEQTVDKIREQAGAHWPMLESVIRQEGAVAKAALLVPEVGKHAGWFEQFRAAVIGGPAKKENENGTTASKPGPREQRKRAASAKPGAAGGRTGRNKADAGADGGAGAAGT